MRLTPTWISDPGEWNHRLRALPTAHILQTWEWGEFKRRTTGWRPERCAYLDAEGQWAAAASLLTRRVGPLRVVYIPKGPLFRDYTDLTTLQAVLDHLQGLARRRGAIWLKLDPDIVVATGLPADAPDDEGRHPDTPDPNGQAALKVLQERGWRFSPDQVQFRNTLTLDLAQGEEELLAGMNQSTRRKLRLAEKAGVTVRSTTSEADLRLLYDLYVVTGQRQGFTTRPWDYYHDLWTIFLQAGLAHVLLAEAEGQALAGLILFHFGQTAWYFYGMSANEQRDRQPTYALQWAAIRWAKAQGYRVYDWWGAPNTFSEADPMSGVYRFKVGFGGQVVRHIGAWDYVPFPPLYWAYGQAAPRLIGWLRRRRSSSSRPPARGES
jgi:lipid II:glycine glycyltransferase (peptidoglycan interpeptide bridge formation enzyme)